MALSGYIQPTGDGLEQTAVLLIEFPVGCWFCEVPEPTGILLIEPPAGQTVKLTRDLVRVEGRLKLNSSDRKIFCTPSTTHGSVRRISQPFGRTVGALAGPLFRRPGYHD